MRSRKQHLASIFLSLIGFAPLGTFGNGAPPNNEVILDMGSLVFKLPEEFHIQRPNPNFFSFNSVWTPWSGLAKDVDPSTMSKLDYIDTYVEVYVQGNIEHGQTYEQWRDKNRSVLENRKPSPIKGLDQYNEGNIQWFISQEASFDYSKNKPLVITCGPGLCYSGDTQSRHCTSGARLNSTTYLNYRFCNKQLPYWSDLHSTIVNFLITHSRSR